MKKTHLFVIINIVVILLSVININYINSNISKNIKEYSNMLASKITKYVINNAYVREKINYYADDIYDIIKDTDTNEIKNIIYDSGVINDLINSITERVYIMFGLIENGDLSKMNIKENILTGSNNSNDGIILEIPSGLLFNNALLSNIGPVIPIRISLTGEFESYVSADIKDYGINNAMVEVYINVKVSEYVTLPFITNKIEIENKIPIFMSLVNGSIPNYYIGGFTKNSNLFQ